MKIQKKNMVISAAHIVHTTDTPCKRIHGHNWKIEVLVGGNVNRKTGMIVDFSDIKREIMVYDHKLLLPESIVETKTKEGTKYCHFMVYDREYKVPRDDCVLLRVKAVTCEELCNCILRIFMMYDNIHYARVIVWETENSSAMSEWNRPITQEEWFGKKDTGLRID